MIRLSVLDSVIEQASAIGYDRIGFADCLGWAIDGVTPLEGAYGDSLEDPTTKLIDRVERRLMTAGHAQVADSCRALRELCKVEACSRVDSFSAACAVTVVSVEGRSLYCALLGDVRVIVRRVGRDILCEDSRHDRFESHSLAFVTELMEKGVSHREALNAVRARLIEHRVQWMNRVGGYWLLSNDADASEQLLCENFEVTRGDVVLLFTDGLARSVTLYRLYSSWSDLLNAALHYGLPAVLGRVRECERNDEECVAFPRIKASDDAAAILFDVRES